MQGISVAPLWDSKEQQFVGMLTASDFIEIVMQVVLTEVFCLYYSYCSSVTIVILNLTFSSS
jgi:hypothetical protein